MSYAITDKQAITRLTALWALNESGLGGLLFGLGIPVTGFLVGGFAVILIGLIAWYSNRSYKAIIRATFLVLVVKAAVSPHSPPPAYLAVLFQGFAGALLYTNIRSYKLASVLLAVIAMTESALQKVLIVTLIFGENIWKAINAAAGQLLLSNTNFSWWLIGIYLLLYMGWGFVVGRLTATLPGLIHQKAAPVMQQYRQEKDRLGLLPVKTKPKHQKYFKWTWMAGLLLFILVVFYVTRAANNPGIGYVLLRTLGAIFILLFIVQPLLGWVIKRWLHNKIKPGHATTKEIVIQLPALRAFVQPAYRMASVNNSAWGSFKQFVLIMVIITLYNHHE